MKMYPSVAKPANAPLPEPWLKAAITDVQVDTLGKVFMVWFDYLEYSSLAQPSLGSKFTELS